MATTTGPDLSPAKAAVERLMDDTCTIVRNPNGAADATLNQETMQLEDGPTVPIYSGKCSVTAPRSIGSGEQTHIEAGAQFVERMYRVTIPLGAEPLKGDIVTITSARRDKALVGQVFIVRDIVYSSMAVSRKLACESRT